MPERSRSTVAGWNGPVNPAGAKLVTDPLFLDVRLPAGAAFTAPVASGYNAFLYTYEGSAEVGPSGAAKPLPHRAAGVLSDGDRCAFAPVPAASDSCCSPPDRCASPSYSTVRSS